MILSAAHFTRVFLLTAAGVGILGLSACGGEAPGGGADNVETTSQGLGESTCATISANATDTATISPDITTPTTYDRTGCSKAYIVDVTSPDSTYTQTVGSALDTELFIPVTADELSDKRYRRVVEFGRILDEVTDMLVKHETASTKGFGYTTGNGYYGRYLRLRGVDVMFICDIRKWMCYASTPLWLSVYGSNWQKSSKTAARLALESLEHQSPPRMFVASDGFPTVALIIPTGEESDAIVASVVRQLEHIGELIAGLVPPETAEPSPAAPSAAPPLTDCVPS